jgi:hypothetical protein
MLHPTKARPCKPCEEARRRRADARRRIAERRAVRVVAHRVSIAEGLSEAEAACEATTITVPAEVAQ